MKVGTKSILFGVHQFVWHPLTVLLAWFWLYRKAPNIREVICIIIHDWGYWGKPNMDGPEGESHPELAARLLHRFGKRYHDLCLYHSRHYARNAGIEPSRLCWADKLSILMEPWWLYLPRAWLSGELAEYRMLAHNAGFVPISASHREWHRWIRDRLSTIGREMRGNAVPYVNPKRPKSAAQLGTAPEEKHDEC